MPTRGTNCHHSKNNYALQFTIISVSDSQKAANKADMQFGDIGKLIIIIIVMCSKEVKPGRDRPMHQSTTSSVFLGFDRRYQPRALSPAMVPASTA